MIETALDIAGIRWTNDKIGGYTKALQDAGLWGWSLKAAPIYAVLPDRDIPLDRIAVLRTNPKNRRQKDVLGEAGSGYEILDHVRFGDVLQQLTLSYSNRFEPYSMGEIEEGRKVFFALKQVEPLALPGEIPLDVYLVGITSHDSTLPPQFTLLLGDQRTGALLPTAGDGGTWKIRDRGLVDIPSAEELDAWISEQLRQSTRSLGYAALFEGSREWAGEEVLTALGAPETAPRPTRSRYANKAEAAIRYLPDDTHNSSRLDVFSVVCAYLDRESPVRKTDLGSVRRLRAERAILGASEKLAVARRLGIY